MIVQATIKQALLNMMTELKTMTDTDEAQDKSAELLSKIIVDAIKSADISPLELTIPILPVQVVPASGTGATLAPVPIVTVLGTSKLI